ncbi:hypothetical protein SECTIM467_3 [Brevibacillus phage SecTim467]|uniref:Uncharacterized protein n=2 Tax=Jenstvirus jenst TaxID=1982225 RepID=A0A0K2CP05_9CAUD|nr:hypothetical protein AVV11_gp003 [Brevibacillus phage Jenst]ALA07133.1 hypothetical protein JENST_3 [Brevibacillus phage Jenst]ALA07506.1 hypothetical protein SECTIM467_3 [Brevibacillus phage SecTim467]
MKNESERYKGHPRISSTVSRTMYDLLGHIADNMDFNQPKFARRMKRNRSHGSVMAFIVELALDDPEFVKRLRKHMINDGKFYIHKLDYLDRYFD